MLTVRASPVEDPMMDDVHGLRVRHRNHVALPWQTDASQPARALRAGHDAVVDDLGEHRPHPSAMVLAIPLLPRLLFFCRRCLHVRCDERWRLAGRFPFFHSSQRLAQGFLSLRPFFSQGVMFHPEALDVFLLIQSFPWSREVTSEHSLEATFRDREDTVHQRMSRLEALIVRETA